MLWLWIPAGLVLLAAALCCGAYLYTYYSSPRRKEDPYQILGGGQYQQYAPQTRALVAEMDAIPFEPVAIRSHDGLRLFGRYYHVKDGAPIQLQMHGYRGVALRDLCGGNKLAREAGFNTLVIDQRAHGRSEGRTICFGVQERLDCLAWARYLAERFPGQPIVLVGVSMGAATVLMASDLALPEAVRGIIADCPYSSPRAIIRSVCWSMPRPFRLMYPFAAVSARLLGGFALDSASALASLRRTKLPVLLIHGEADHFVPCEMSRELAAACASPVRLETFPGAAHGMSYLVDTPRYERAVAEFLDDVL